MEKEKVKLWLAVLSTVAAIIIGFVAIIIPPHGVIDSSVLWWSAQLLVFCSTLLGLSMTVDNLGHKITNLIQHEERMKENKNIQE